MSRLPLAVIIPLTERALAALQREYEVEYLPHMPSRAVRAIVTNGSTGLSAAQMAALPALEIVCCYGAGYENVDLAAARERGVAVAHAPGVNDETVADHALALMLALARGIASVDRAVKAGRWRTSRGERPTLHGARLGLIGLGNIGAKIAARAQAFGMSIGYHTRRSREVAWRHFTNVVELARNSDFLVAACPGGHATRHIVNDAVLAALGPGGFLVNVSRGSVVDTAALARALQSNQIAGAGLDVLEEEPEVPTALLAAENVVLTPHIAGRSPAAVAAQTAALLASLQAHFGRRALPFPVPLAERAA